MNLDIGLDTESKPGSSKDIKRRIPRGLRHMMVNGIHPDDMPQPCQELLLKFGLIEPSNQGAWRWSKRGRQIQGEYAKGRFK